MATEREHLLCTRWRSYGVFGKFYCGLEGLGGSWSRFDGLTRRLRGGSNIGNPSLGLNSIDVNSALQLYNTQSLQAKLGSVPEYSYKATVFEVHLSLFYPTARNPPRTGEEVPPINLHIRNNPTIPLRSQRGNPLSTPDPLCNATQPSSTKYQQPSMPHPPYPHVGLPQTAVRSKPSTQNTTPNRQRQRITHTREQQGRQQAQPFDDRP